MFTFVALFFCFFFFYSVQTLAADNFYKKCNKYLVHVDSWDLSHINRKQNEQTNIHMYIHTCKYMHIRMYILKTCTAYTHLHIHINILTNILLIIIPNHAENSKSSDMKRLYICYLSI